MVSNGSFHEFCRLKALITLELLITSMVDKKNNLHEQNFEVYWKIRIEDRLKTIENKMNKSWIVVINCTKILKADTKQPWNVQLLSRNFDIL